MWLELRGLPRFKVLPDRFGPERLFGQSVSSNHIHVHARTDTCNHTHGRIARPRLASPRLAPLAASPHSPRHACPRLAFACLYSPRIARIARIASLGLTSRLASHRSIASHRLARIASLASPRSHRLALHRIASLAVTSPRPPPARIGSFASPRLARLASMLASPLSPCLASLALPRLSRLASPRSPFASPRSPCLASRSLASPRLRARLPRSPCLLPRLGHRAARHLGLSLPSTLPSKPARHTRSSIEPPNSIFGWDGYSQFELG